MNVVFAINAVIFLFAVLGAVDYLLNDRFGLGSQFERGICCSGKLIIAMVGFMSIAPILGQLLTPIVSPFFSALGADPSAFASILLANDSGGAALAAEMALDPVAGEFNGYIVASMLGASVSCVIPMTMLSAGEENSAASIYGLMLGLVTIPLGCFVGGMAAGYSLSLLLRNLIPAALLSVALLIVLLVFGQRAVPPFCVFGKLLICINLTGLLLTTAQELLGLKLVHGLTPFVEIIPVIGNIVLMLSGVFPLLAVVSKLLKKNIQRAAHWLHIKEDDMFGILMTSVNLFPTFDMLPEMSKRGALLNIAFMVSANCMLGDHFAFTSQACPKLVLPMILAKATAAFSALGLAYFLSPRLLAASTHRA